MAIKLAKVSQIEEGKSLIVESPEGKEIALVKLDGEIYAFENICPHMGGPVGEGEIENNVITCPWHGWEFNVKDSKELSRVPIQIKDDDIYLI